MPDRIAIDITGFSGAAGDKPKFVRDPKEALKHGQPEKITCAICDFQGRSLARHLKSAHNMSKKEYIERCGYPKGTKLTSKKFSKERHETAMRVRPFEKTQRYQDAQAKAQEESSEAEAKSSKASKKKAEEAAE